MSAVGTVVPKVLPPPSPFGELLRRSRFASFDPDIRQAYTAPPSYIHRGNWGLKRPIANRHPKGHIVLRKFEEHAQYIEWDRADSQVKFIRRIEELNSAPKLVSNSPWSTGLGQVSTSKDSGLDSDFCPGESSEIILEKDERFVEQKPSIADLGNRGKGNYSTIPAPTEEQRAAAQAMARPDETLLQRNIFAMRPGEFKDYVEELRALRPQFIKYVRKELQTDRDKERTGKRRKMSDVDPKSLSDEEIMFEMGLEAQKKRLHMAFLGRYTEDQINNLNSEVEDPKALANAPQPIRQQPHKFGGLVYAMPSELDSYYMSKPQPGLVLQDGTPSSGSSRVDGDREGEYIASFAGLSSHLTKEDSGKDVRPLYEPFTTQGIVSKRVVDPETGKTTFNIEDSERKMRLLHLYLEDTPRVVGQQTGNVPLLQVRMRSHVVVDNGVDHNFRDNPYPPGSKEYISLQPMSGRPRTVRPPIIKPSRDYFSGAAQMRSKFNAQLPSKGTLPVSSGSKSLRGSTNDLVLDSLNKFLKNGNGVGKGRLPTSKKGDSVDDS